MAINKNYLQLEFGSGNFFIYSGVQKEGFEAHTSNKGNTSYRKYFKDGITGVLDSVSIYEGKFGQQISMNIKDGEEIYYVPVDINDQQGNVDTYAESLIKLLPLLTKGDNLAVRGYNFIPEGSAYSKIGISISVDGEKIKPLMTNAYYKAGVLVPGDIPAIEWKLNKLGKNKPTAVSLEAKNEYLLDRLFTETERLKWVASNAAPTETPKPGKEVPKATPAQAFDIPEEDDDDDLPF